MREVEGNFGTQWKISGRSADGWDWSAYTVSRAAIDLCADAVESRDGIALEATVKGIRDGLDGRKRVSLVRLRPC